MRIATHVGGILPLILLASSFFSGTLGANPIQALEQRTGVLALNFLALSLACTPLSMLTGYKPLLSRRKALGNYGFMYAATHVLTFIGIDYGFNFGFILADSVNKKFIWLGLTAFLMLASLSFTSFPYWQKKMGKNWKNLHRLVYYISPIIVVHFLLSIKGNITNFQGNIIKPLIYGMVILILLVLRNKNVKEFIKSH